MNGKTDLVASIRDRLLNRARADKVEFQQMPPSAYRQRVDAVAVSWQHRWGGR